MPVKYKLMAINIINVVNHLLATAALVLTLPSKIPGKHKHYAGVTPALIISRPAGRERSLILAPDGNRAHLRPLTNGVKGVY